MLLNKKVLSLVNVASTDATRQTLCGVYIEPDGSGVGCDGHMLLKFTPCAPWDAKEYPAMEGLTIAEDPPTELKPFILSRDACTQIARAMPKKCHFPVLRDNIALDVGATNDNGAALMATTDLENPQVLRPRKVEGEYPDYRKVFPDAKPQVEVGLSVANLEKLVKAMKALNVEAIKVGVIDSVRPVIIKAETKDRDGTIDGLVMPWRL
jgi:hypothetical protein